MRSTTINKSFFSSTENITRLAVLIVGIVATLFGLPDDLAGELEGSAVAAVTSIAGLIAVLITTWSFITEGGNVRTATFISGFTDRIGWQTQEFWISIAGTIVGLLALFGIVSEPLGDQLNELLPTLIEAIFALLTLIGPAIFYSRTRTKVKTAVAEAL